MPEFHGEYLLPGSPGKADVSGPLKLNNKPAHTYVFPLTVPHLCSPVLLTLSYYCCLHSKVYKYRLYGLMNFDK